MKTIGRYSLSKTSNSSSDLYQLGRNDREIVPANNNAILNFLGFGNNNVAKPGTGKLVGFLESPSFTPVFPTKEQLDFIASEFSYKTLVDEVEDVREIGTNIMEKEYEVFKKSINAMPNLPWKLPDDNNDLFFKKMNLGVFFVNFQRFPDQAAAQQGIFAKAIKKHLQKLRTQPVFRESVIKDIIEETGLSYQEFVDNLENVRDLIFWPRCIQSKYDTHQLILIAKSVGLDLNENMSKVEICSELIHSLGDVFEPTDHGGQKPTVNWIRDQQAFNNANRFWNVFGNRAAGQGREEVKGKKMLHLKNKQNLSILRDAFYGSTETRNPKIERQNQIVSEVHSVNNQQSFKMIGINDLGYINGDILLTSYTTTNFISEKLTQWLDACSVDKAMVATYIDYLQGENSLDKIFNMKTKKSQKKVDVGNQFEKNIGADVKNRLQQDANDLLH